MYLMRKILIPTDLLLYKSEMARQCMQIKFARNEHANKNYDVII